MYSLSCTVSSLFSMCKDCPQVVSSIVGSQGMVVTGTVTPPLRSVSVQITADDGAHELTETDENGRYTYVHVILACVFYYTLMHCVVPYTKLFDFHFWPSFKYYTFLVTTSPVRWSFCVLTI